MSEDRSNTANLLHTFKNLTLSPNSDTLEEIARSQATNSKLKGKDEKRLSTIGEAQAAREITTFRSQALGEKKVLQARLTALQERKSTTEKERDVLPAFIPKIQKQEALPWDVSNRLKLGSIILVYCTLLCYGIINISSILQAESIAYMDFKFGAIINGIAMVTSSWFIKVYYFSIKKERNQERVFQAMAWLFIASFSFFLPLFAWSTFSTLDFENLDVTDTSATIKRLSFTMQLIWEYLLSGLLLIYATKLYESFSKKYTTIQTPNPARVPVQERIDACNEEIANTEKDFLVVQEILAQITPLLNEHQEKTKARYAWLLSEMKSDPVTP